MPFFIEPFLYKTNKKINPCISKIAHNKHKSFNTKRVYLSSSKLNGSLSLEAALVFPIFILFCISIFYIQNLINLENTIYIYLNEACRSISKTSFLERTLSDSEELSQIYDISKIASEFRENSPTDYLNASRVSGGKNGISFMFSSANPETGILDICANYKINLSFIPDSILPLSMCERIYFHPFVGKSIADGEGDYSLYVYITLQGDVYHTSPYCSYLTKYYTYMSDYEFDTMLDNKDSFSPCPNCANEGVTPNQQKLYCPGNKTYHYDPTCLYLDHHALKVTYESIKDEYEICTRCGKSKDTK